VETPTSFIFTSPQLPGWKGAWPTRKSAEDHAPDSLRGYLRRNSRKLPSEIREELWAMIISTEPA
jgi:hypothetical protein